MMIFKSAVVINMAETRKSLDVDDAAQYFLVVKIYSTNVSVTSITCMSNHCSSAVSKAFLFVVVLTVTTVALLTKEATIINVMYLHNSFRLLSSPPRVL